MKTHNRIRLLSAALALAVVIAIQTGVHTPQSAGLVDKSEIIRNSHLAQIDAAITSWAATNGMPSSARPSTNQLRIHMRVSRLAICPQRGVYTLGSAFRPSSCSIFDQDREDQVAKETDRHRRIH